MEGDQWPPPLTPMINRQQDDPISSSFLYNTNYSSTSSSMNYNLLTNQMVGDPPDNINWVHLLSQQATGCSTSSSTAAYNNHHQDLLLPPSSSSPFSRLFAAGEDHQEGNKKSSLEDEVRNKVGRKVKKVVPPRVAFHTRSQDDILDDGYKWRKYGQKAVKNCNFPRSYYHCTRHTCNVKKQIQRLSKDPGTVVTTYEGIHNHPCEQFMETLIPLLNQIQFSRKF